MSVDKILQLTSSAVTHYYTRQYQMRRIGYVLGVWATNTCRIKVVAQGLHLDIIVIESRKCAQK